MYQYVFRNVWFIRFDKLICCSFLSPGAWFPCLTGPGSVFIQSTHTGRLARAGRAAAQRASGGTEMVKAVVFTLVVMIAVFSFLEWEEV